MAKTPGKQPQPRPVFGSSTILIPSSAPVGAHAHMRPHPPHPQRRQSAGKTRFRIVPVNNRRYRAESLQRNLLYSAPVAPAICRQNSCRIMPVNNRRYRAGSLQMMDCDEVVINYLFYSAAIAAHLGAKRPPRQRPKQAKENHRSEKWRFYFIEKYFIPAKPLY